MKKSAKNNISTFIRKPKKKRAGIVAKTKNSKLKGSKNYKKRYKGQGR